MTQIYTKTGMLFTALLLFCSLQMYGQTKISGTVVDETEAVLPNVTIRLKTNPSTLTSTDSKGHFQINVNNENEYLILSFVGYARQEVAVKGNTALTIHMKPTAGGLNEVVVVGYGTQKKVDLTGAVSTVSGEVLENRPIDNIGRGLQGELPGLNITSYNGKPGTPATFNIRGFTSINGGGPLILVDGVETSLDDINPDDVASATVLKDAASSAVYGSRAAFGVLLITTKSGHTGAPKITYNFNYSVHKITNLPDVVTDPGTVVDYKNEAYSAYYGSNLYNATETAYAHQRSANPSLPATIVDPSTGQYDYLGGTNWFNEAYKSGNPSQIHNISVSGGTDKVTYYFSAGYNSQDGIFRYNPDYYDRYNLRAKLDIELTKWLHITTNSAYNRTTYNSPSLQNGYWVSQGDFFHAIGRENSLAVPKNPDGSWTSAGVAIGFLEQGGRTDTVNNRTQNTIGFNTSFFNNSLRIKGDYTFRSTNNYMQGYQIPVPYETGPDKTVSYAGTSLAYAAADDQSYYNINLYAEYEKNFGTKNYFKAVLGYNQEENNYNSFSASNNNLISNSIGTLNETTGTPPSVGANGYQWALRGYFARLNYEYDKKYLLEIAAREDGSSLFPSDQHYGFFPSASVGWRVSEEPFFKSLLNVVNSLKFRASYGSLGNDQSLQNYQFIPVLTSGTTGSILGGTQQTYVGAPNLVSPNITWETITTKNLGIDVTFFKKLNATFDIYRRYTNNMITQGFALPAVLGATQPLENAADLRTDGWELNLTYNDETTIAGKPFKYGIHANLWDNQSIITKYYNPTGYFLNNPINGSPAYYNGAHVGDIWGLTDIGIFQTNAAAKAAPDQSLFQGYYNLNQAGELQYKDLNHDGKITYGNGTISNPGDMSVIGNTTPRYNFGFGGNFTYDNFDFSVFFQGVGKESFYPGNSGYYWGMFFAPWENVYQNIVGNTWTPQNTNAFYPSLKGWRAGDAGSLLDLATPQSRYIYSAAYIRLKNLTVGYTFPMPMLKKIGVDRIRVYVSGEDLWESDKLPQGYDPEGLRGYASGELYPFQRAYSFGVDVKF
ncbi:TonB-linked outer membrane protein, SusC/RagA family [Mucilaginibacter mallensis]|uniref:TonB-linked outer membrane protein, SusC/RagA family n=1 Tax=Mucilaginibacter mallensis TaxID=652787 RepID=A0A1H1YTN6_MUCMA|nr:TonB-dependent receptor [Mucilaginibacter mallensis]SDT24750.1 TonB-linked outer membrane protein, SusC/RagA family [Mucilaginibacter mallensis]